jgi:serine/threonine-protein kinase
VKAGVQNLEAEGSEVGQQGTTVGKAGYAPNEQLQTGEAYANSDLYALAVTVVVMMTGRKPESLIDKATMNWKWSQWLPTISPWFAKVLLRMMSYRPNNRYQSAKEVRQALRSVADLVGSTSELLTDGSPSSASIGAYATSSHSQVNQSHQSGHKYTTYTPKQQSRSQLWTNPLVLIAAGGVIILIPFMLFKILMPGEINPSPMPTESTSKRLSPKPTPTIDATATNPTTSPSVVVQPSPLVTTEMVSLTAGQPPSIKENTLI